MENPQEITRLLQAAHEGHGGADADRLLELVYDHLREIASRLMRAENVAHTLQPTVLVHDAWMRLARQGDARWESRGQFLAVAAVAMRQMLVSHARRRSAAKRGGAAERHGLESIAASYEERSIDLVALGDALDHLRERNEQAARIVDCRFFAGLSVEETAEALGISSRTVKRGWALARDELSATLDF